MCIFQKNALFASKTTLCYFQITNLNGINESFLVDVNSMRIKF